MTLSSCPKCEELNAQDALYCVACGTPLSRGKVSSARSQSWIWSYFIRENITSILGIVLGIMIILAGIYLPGIASLIIQTVLIFTSNDHFQTRMLNDAKSNNSDGWWVIAAGAVCILFCSSSLYAVWKTSRLHQESSIDLPDNER